MKSYVSRCSHVRKELPSVSQLFRTSCQGSSVSDSEYPPLLFVMFINDLPHALTEAKVALYADDTAIFYSSNNIENVQSVLSREIESVATWLSDNQLTLNLSKPKTMTFGSRQKIAKNGTLDIDFSGKKLENVKTFKYLGVHMDENLTWEEHVNVVCKKASKRIGLLKRISKFLDFSSKKLLYNSLILPIFDYCDVIWGNCAKCLSDRVQLLQNRAGRVVLGVRGLYRDTHISDLLTSLKWDRLDKRRKFHLDCCMFRSINSGPPSLKNMFKYVNNTHAYSTRSSTASLLSLPRCRLVIGQRSFGYRGAVSFNNLPSSLRDSQSILHFKRSYKTFVQ